MTPLWKLYKYLPKRASTPMLRCRDEELELTPDKYKNNRSKSACTLNARKRLNNQAVWPVIFDITGPICVRALKTMIPLTLGPCGHHDWPVMSASRPSELVRLIVWSNEEQAV